jgi:uncharacterized protein (DUF433 family)
MSARRSAAANDPRNQQSYPLSEAARYLRLPPATLRSWTVGRPYPTARGEGQFRPLIKPATQEPPVLSFWNLIEAHVLRALRTEHAVSIKAVRQAIDFAERKLQVERLLLSPELSSAAGQLFLDRYGELIHLEPSGQLAMRSLFEAHLKRVEWDQSKFPVRLHPFVGVDLAADKMPIAIDANISFGRPIVASAGVSTAAIAGRIDAGEMPEAVADDYGVTLEEVRLAVVYERAA